MLIGEGYPAMTSFSHWFKQEGGVMSCLICAGQAESIACTDGWEERHCSQCGRYRMSSALVFTLMEQGQIFDTERMRTWLRAQRCEVSLPIIDIDEALLAR
ncbi:hypothetical protein PSE10B_46880 [Pseudomonas amygdali pv. eriobotryae]|uniref:Uncharacterized protein n=1 Tax=Pseudomonas amygdali pv. eriobotryae TaxID=129137 RepID=A0A9P3AKA4_PSEA0|nr:hypothetical protein PSE10A_55860 [Pseudomonas amygdali pv. eriobotryae]GFZ68166.1 hypothetical protein PSE10B_46880 [Pseudomonas amygdali pv. eriobotryae]